MYVLYFHVYIVNEQDMRRRINIDARAVSQTSRGDAFGHGHILYASKHFKQNRLL
jgi:hypothetical protein